MGLISKITGHSSSSDSTKNVDHDTTTSTQQANRLDERTGTSTGTTTTSTTGARGGAAEHAAEKVTGRDLNHDGNVGKGVHGTTSTTGVHGTHGTTSTTGATSTTGSRGGAAEHAAEKVTGRDLNHDGNVGRGVHGTTSTTTGSSVGHTTDRVNNLSVNDTTTTGSRGGSVEHGVERATGRDLNRDGQIGGEGERRVQHAAPIVQERIHDQYEHVDKERREEIRNKTRVEQVVQPIYDERQEAVQRERVDHGLEVHEHGEKGLTRAAEAELARNREQIAREHANTRDETTTQTNARTAADVQTRVHKVEEVVPVLERDIYRPHEIVHDKRVLHIHHDGVDGVHTRVNEPVSIKEFEREHGHLHTTGGTTGTHGSSTLERGAERATGRDLNHDGSVGSSTTHGTYTTSDAHAGKKHTGIGEKIEHVGEKVTHKDLDHDGDVAGKPVAGSSSTTGNRGGAVEHGAERATGRDLNRDGNVGGSHNVGTTSTTGYNTTGVTGHNTTGTTGYNNTTGTTGYNNTTSTTGNRGGALEHGAEKVTGRDLNHDGNVGKGQQFAGGHVLPNNNQRQL